MKRPLLIGLTGASGSGKTTFIERLIKSFPEEAVTIISQDNYYRNREDQTPDSQGVLNFDLPTSINREEFFRDVKRLLNCETVTREEYTFNNPLKKPKMLSFEPRPIIIVEGIFVFHYTEIFDLLDFKVYLHAKETTSLSRRIKRDRIERNYPLEDVLYRYEQHVLPTYERYIKPYKDLVDVVINNNMNFDKGLQILSGFLKQHLESNKD